MNLKAIERIVRKVMFGDEGKTPTLLKGDDTVSALQDRASQQFYSVYQLVANKMWDSEYYLQDMYANEEGMFAISNNQGIMYKHTVQLIADGTVELGEAQQVTMEFLPATSEGRIKIARQDDDNYRWVGIVCTAVLNRDNQLDSRDLFDGFVSRIEESGEYPLIDFMHDNRIVLGTTDYIKRSEYTLVASGLLRNDEIGQAIARTLEEDSDGYWGFSTQFYPEAFEMLQIADGVEVPMYTDGSLDRITICPEAKAASWFTSIKRNQEEREMDKIVREELANLVGDEALVEVLEEEVDGVTSRVADGAIARQAEGADEDTPLLDATVPEVEQANPPSDADTSLQDTLTRLSEANVEIVKRLNETIGLVEGHMEAFLSMETRLAALETDQDQQHRQWLGDLPIPVNVRQITRPRVSAEESDPEPDPQERINQTLSSKGLSI